MVSKRFFGAVAAVVVVAIALLVPFHPEALLLQVLRAVTPDTSAAHRIDWVLIETGGNLLVFAVDGLSLLLALRRPAIAVLLGLLLSSLAEVTQLVIPTRVASVTDVATNGVGTVVGVLAGLGAARWMRHRAAQRRTLHDPIAPRV